MLDLFVNGCNKSGNAVLELDTFVNCCNKGLIDTVRNYETVNNAESMLTNTVFFPVQVHLTGNVTCDTVLAIVLHQCLDTRFHCVSL